MCAGSASAGLRGNVPFAAKIVPLQKRTRMPGPLPPALALDDPQDTAVRDPRRSHVAVKGRVVSKPSQTGYICRRHTEITLRGGHIGLKRSGYAA